MSDERHGCKRMIQEISDSLDDSLEWGIAIDNIRRGANGRWIAANGEYGVYINYCPFCGKKLPEIEPRK